jgi:HlyD family secretion protein
MFSLRNTIRRLWLPGLGLILVPALAVQTGALDGPFAGLARLSSTTESFAGAGSRGPRSGSPTADRREPRSIDSGRVVAEGRVSAYPGAEVVVGCETSGRIVSLAVTEKSVVRRGDLLAELNAEDLEASIAEAKAKIAEVEADRRYDARELQREQNLLARRAGTPEARDSMRHNLETAEARLAGAIAAKERLEALLAKTRVLAPIDGVVTARHVHPGETIEANAKVVTIVDLDRLRIEAEVDEFDIDCVRLGAPVRITAEGYATVWRGTVEEIPDAVVGRRLRPGDPGRPIDARVLPVKIAVPRGSELKLGQRVEVEIESPGIEGR